MDIELRRVKILKEAYHLVSAIQHIGPSASSGHYLSYVQKGEQWLKISDESVKKLPKGSTVSDHVTDGGYIFIYERR